MFELKILRQHWIKDDGLNDSTDLCSHGQVYLRIGDEVLSDKNSGSWTLTAAGLFMMRTLTIDCTSGELENFLLPCCGHFMVFNEDGKNVEIPGCVSGVDWGVNHDGTTVLLTTEAGNETITPFDDYRKAIVAFVKEVEAFYGNPENKVIDDDYDREMFELFWNEWHELKHKWDY